MVLIRFCKLKNGLLEAANKICGLPKTKISKEIKKHKKCKHSFDCDKTI